MNGKKIKTKTGYWLLLTLLLASCSRSFEPVDFGKDGCVFCKMTITDRRFAAELVSGKGKVFKFDDLGCLLNYMKEEKLSSKECLVYVSDYSAASISFFDAHKGFFLQHAFFKSPMNGNCAAFTSLGSAQPYMDSLKINYSLFTKLEEDVRK